MSGAVATLARASKRFGERLIINDLDLQIRRNEFVALLGASGSGKTTLLRILLGLEQLDGGEGVVATPRSVVFQEPRLAPSMRVWKNVLLGVPAAQRNRARAMAALDEVGLVSHADAWPGTLSGGEAQRVALARALAIEPALLLLDEPFAALDALTRLRMQDLVRRLCARHRPGVLLVTHDVDEAIRLADRILVLRDGALVVDVRVSGQGEWLDTGGESVGPVRRLLYETLGVPGDGARRPVPDEDTAPG